MSELTLTAGLYDADPTAPTAVFSKALTTAEDCFDYRKIFLSGTGTPISETTHTIDSTVSSSGYCYIYFNPDYNGSDISTDRYVEFGFATAASDAHPMKIFPGYGALIPLADGTDTLYFRPRTNCEISIYVREQ